jgi:apyrase
MKKVLFILFLFVGCVQVHASSQKFALIIDAGSSGSRIYVYAYAKKLPIIPIPIIYNLYEKSTAPGLSSYANTPALAGPSLEPILSGAYSYLLSIGANPATTPISVLGTAGMRLLPDSDQQAIFDSVFGYIQQNYPFIVNRNQIKTISGAEEGLYAWISTNYLLNNFLTNQTTSGVLDMGGASTQIVYQTSQPSTDVLSFTINQKLYQVFSKSYLGMGQNETRNTMNTYPNAASCYPKGYNGQPNPFSFNDCTAIYQNIIHNNHVGENLPPFLTPNFVAISGYYYDFNFFGVAQTPYQSALTSQIKNICSKTWAELQILYPNTPNLANYCANGTYVDELLYQTYQISGTTLTVTLSINNQLINWALGALLYNIENNIYLATSLVADLV